MALSHMKLSNKHAVDCKVLSVNFRAKSILGYSLEMKRFSDSHRNEKVVSFLWSVFTRSQSSWMSLKMIENGICTEIDSPISLRVFLKAKLSANVEGKSKEISLPLRLIRLKIKKLLLRLNFYQLLFKSILKFYEHLRTEKTFQNSCFNALWVSLHFA